jgi:hypothetical protein
VIFHADNTSIYLSGSLVIRIRVDELNTISSRHQAIAWFSFSTTEKISLFRISYCCNDKKNRENISYNRTLQSEDTETKKGQKPRAGAQSITHPRDGDG